MANQRSAPTVTMSHQKPKSQPRPKHPISSNYRQPSLSLTLSSRGRGFVSWEERVAAILKLDEERVSANIKNSGVGLSYPGIDCGSVGSYPFLDEPVQFQFEDDYGKELFRQLQREVLSASVDHVSTLGARVNSADDDVYSLQTEKDMVASFLKENLF